MIDVTRHGRHVATLDPSEGYYASQEASQGTVGSLIGGQPVSHVSMDAGLTRDVWSAIEPNIETPALQRIVNVGNRRYRPKTGSSPIGYLARAYLQNPPQAQFHFIVSPLVMWIWIGGLIVVGGALVAFWPAPGALRRRVRRARRTPLRASLLAARECQVPLQRSVTWSSIYRDGKARRWQDYRATDTALRVEALRDTGSALDEL